MTSKNRRVYILGSGQLARMFCEAAQELSIQSTLLALHKDDCAAAMANETLLGDMNSETQLTDFLKSAVQRKSDNEIKIVFENEFIKVDWLKPFEKLVNFVPNLNCIEVAQNKFFQKELFSKLKLNTSAFEKINKCPSLLEWIDLEKKFPNGTVFKWASYGYDGKGVFLKPPTSGNLNLLNNFFSAAQQKNTFVYIEEKVNFNQELAMTACRDHNGNISFYPLVLSEQNNGVCFFVKGPATLWGISKEIESAAQHALRSIANHLDLVGVFAVEFFYSSKNKTLMLNEMAPRVHNSSHYSLLNKVGNQFNQHLRAAFDLPLENIQLPQAFAMLNLLGPESSQILKNQKPVEFSDFQTHWYEKNKLTAGRKMGHINICATSKEELEKKIISLLQHHQRWVESL